MLHRPALSGDKCLPFGAGVSRTVGRIAISGKVASATYRGEPDSWRNVTVSRRSVKGWADRRFASPRSVQRRVTCATASTRPEIVPRRCHRLRGGGRPGGKGQADN